MADALQRQVADSARRQGLDVALRNSPTTAGKLTFVWGPDGDLVFDDEQGYPTLLTVFAVKGRCWWDRSMGTLLLTLKRSRRATGSQLQAYARDGGAQLEAEGLVKDFGAQATLKDTGRWNLTLKWAAAGRERRKSVEV